MACPRDLLGSFLALLLPALATASGPVDTAVTGAVETTLQTRIDAVPDDPGSTSTIAGARSKLAIESSTDKTTASFKIGDTWAYVAKDEKADGTLSLAASAKTPFNSDKDSSADLGTLSGLTDGTSLKLEAGYLWWPRIRPSQRDLAFGICEAAVRAMFPGYTYGLAPDAGNDAALRSFAAAGASCPQMFGSEAALKKAVEQRNAASESAIEKAKKDGKPLQAPPPAQIGPQTEDTRQQVMLDYGVQERGATRDAYGFNLALTANQQKFSYASEAAPSTVTDDHKYGYGATLSYSWIRDRAVLSAGASFERSYKGGKEVQICNPIGSTGSFSCADGALKAPKESTDELLSIEYRTILSARLHFAMSPRVEYSIEKSDFGVRLPFYLAADPKRLLDGGIALGWTHDEHFGASVFVGKSFSFF